MDRTTDINDILTINPPIGNTVAQARKNFEQVSDAEVAELASNLREVSAQSSEMGRKWLAKELSREFIMTVEVGQTENGGLDITVPDYFPKDKMAGVAKKVSDLLKGNYQTLGHLGITVRPRNGIG